jgi:hypothetical protein
MLISAIIWILVGSACLWLCTFNVIFFAWAFAFVKKMIWGTTKEIKKETT